MRILVLASLLAIVACDAPMFHQDRPGGSDYDPYLWSRSHPPSASEMTTREQIVQTQRECDYGNEAACNWMRTRRW